MALPHWLFVTYGGGHVRALLPVARLAHERGLARVSVLGLTTAAREVVAAGLPLLRYADLLTPGDPATGAALAWGERLLGTLDVSAVGRDETVAYLGLNYLDLIDAHGEAGAAEQYARFGRQCFEPRRLMTRLLRQRQPDLVVATSAPRSERAVLQAAADLGLSAACVVDLFALDEVAWVGQRGFAQRVCVLNEGVRQHLLRAGRTPDEVVVTGNPAFDGLTDARWHEPARQWRAAHGLEDRHVVLFISGLEYAEHPMRPGVSGDPLLPMRIAGELARLTQAAPRLAAVVRPHPSEGDRHRSAAHGLPVCGQDVPIEVAIHAADTVVVISSTVAVQATLCGKWVIQVKGGLFEDTAPYLAFGYARALLAVDELGAGLMQSVQARQAGSGPAQAGPGTGERSAADAVLAVLQSLAAPPG